MTIRRLTLAAIAVLSSAAHAQTHAQSATETTHVLDRILTQGEVRPLAAIAAVRLRHGRVAYSYYGGFARRTPDGTVPVGPQTLFRIASISKVVTTIGLMELVEQGKIDLDHDASDYLGFRLRNPDFPQTPITVRMLLNHTSSICDADSYTLPPDQKISTFFDTTRKPGDPGYHFAHGDGHAPGTWFSYCNLCYGLVGTIMERVSGERFDRYQQTHVLAPLGIDGGYNRTALPHPERLATLYSHQPKGWEAETDTRPLAPSWSAASLAPYTPGTNGTLFSPQGGLRISMEGLTRLARFMLGHGTLDGRTLLSAHSIAQMQTPTWQYDGQNGDCPYPIASYGLSMARLTGARDPSGRETRPYKGYSGHLAGHLGDAYSLHSGFWYDPATGDGFLFAADGFPDAGQERPGTYSSFTRVEEEIFTALAGAGKDIP
ncbi:serine hydrolase domain-containing protein [Gluconobacter albidus]|uniref:serine hydrolase domain-containing protein n=1 Tax=Gluconobacter albidus TaxID=318683 RepID=UPI001B8C575B|nr:serine hydrolase domain-containing protein [Gluconobacter albidus]MBS1027288.1 beta-lactamase family protein [Gluconobacter albidus]